MANTWIAVGSVIPWAARCAWAASSKPSSVKVGKLGSLGWRIVACGDQAPVVKPFAGILLGGYIAANLLTPVGYEVQVNAKLLTELQQYGITHHESLVPQDIFNWSSLLTLKGFLLMIVGGFLVGFGTRYAGGCTSGHAIMGLSNLQWPSLVATCCFMAGGFIMSNLIMPILLKL